MILPDNIREDRQGIQGNLNGSLLWYEQFFGDPYLRIYGPFLSQEKWKREALAVLRLLGLSEKSSILDLGCGVGGHARELRRQGYQVTGVDLSEVLLQVARNEASVQGVNDIEWIRRDIRSLRLGTTYDVALLLSSPLGYFDEDDQDLCALIEVANALKAGGAFLIAVKNPYAVLKTLMLKAHLIYETGLIVLEDRYFDSQMGRLLISLTEITEGGARNVYTHSLRLYTVPELERMFQCAGLQKRECYGDWTGKSFDMDSPHLIIVGQKKI